jgi:hypothetical protein
MGASFTEEYIKAYYEIGTKKDHVIIDSLYAHYQSVCKELSAKDSKIVPVPRMTFGRLVKGVYDTKRSTARIPEMGGAVKPVYARLRRRDKPLQLKKVGGFWLADPTRTLNDNQYASKKISPELVREEFLKVYGELEVQMSKCTDDRESRAIVSTMIDVLDKLAKLCGAYKEDTEAVARMNHLDNVLNSNYKVNKSIENILNELCRANPNG